MAKTWTINYLNCFSKPHLCSHNKIPIYSPGAQLPLLKLSWQQEKNERWQMAQTAGIVCTRLDSDTYPLPSLHRSLNWGYIDVLHGCDAFKRWPPGRCGPSLHNPMVGALQGGTQGDLHTSDKLRDKKHVCCPRRHHQPVSWVLNPAEWTWIYHKIHAAEFLSSQSSSGVTYSMSCTFAEVLQHPHFYICI